MFPLHRVTKEEYFGVNDTGNKVTFKGAGYLRSVFKIKV